MDDILVAYIGTIVREILFVDAQGVPWSIPKHLMAKILLTLAEIMTTTERKRLITIGTLHSWSCGGCYSCIWFVVTLLHLCVILDDPLIPLLL